MDIYRMHTAFNLDVEELDTQSFDMTSTTGSPSIEDAKVKQANGFVDEFLRVLDVASTSTPTHVRVCFHHVSLNQAQTWLQGGTPEFQGVSNPFTDCNEPFYTLEFTCSNDKPFYYKLGKSYSHNGTQRTRQPRR